MLTTWVFGNVGAMVWTCFFLHFFDKISSSLVWKLRRPSTVKVCTCFRGPNGSPEGQIFYTRIVLESSKFTQVFARLLGSASHIYKLWIGSFPLGYHQPEEHWKTQKSLFYLPYLSFILWCVIVLSGLVLFYSLHSGTSLLEMHLSTRLCGRRVAASAASPYIVWLSCPRIVSRLELRRIHGWWKIGNGRCWCLAITFWGAFQALWGDVVQLFLVSVVEANIDSNECVRYVRSRSSMVKDSNPLRS